MTALSVERDDCLVLWFLCFVKELVSIRVVVTRGVGRSVQVQPAVPDE